MKKNMIKYMRVSILFFTILFVFDCFAQSPAEADALFNQRKYEESGRIYAELLSRRPTDPLYNYRFARCSYELNNYDDAIRFFLAGGNRYPLRDYYLADSYFKTYRFSEAIEYFNSYASSATVNQNFLKDVYDKLGRARIAVRLMNRVEDIEIIDSAVVAKKDFLKHYRLSKETGKFTQQTLSSNKREWIDLVSFITQRGDRKIFSDTVSNQIDLFKSNKLLDGWSKPESLSKNINTEADENYPFLMLDGVTLYFASNGENSIGGYDIFITRFTSNTNDYLNPENIGMPFNSIYNDYMYVIDEVAHKGWFVTDRYQPEDKVIIYQFRHRDEKTFVPIDDVDYLIKAAKLKVFRKADKIQDIIDKSIEVPLISEPHNILFIVNDTIAYTNTNQFKSATALKLWNEWYRISATLTDKENELLILRATFEETQDAIVQQTLRAEILTLEQLVIKSKHVLLEKIKNIRNEEINYLKNSLMK